MSKKMETNYRERALRIAFGTTILVLLLVGGAWAAKAANVIINSGDSIQDAVNKAASGDTILINGGIYNENVLVNKTLNIVGDTAGSVPVINGGIILKADSITIEGLRITGADIGILVNSNNDVIKNNIVVGNNLGIKLIGNGNKVFNNYLDNSQNALDSGSNQWNTEKTSGANIVGGLYLAGNYWSDYRGSDADSDGIGDTAYKSASVTDALPLFKNAPVPAQEKLTLPDAPPVTKSSQAVNKNFNSNPRKEIKSFDSRYLLNKSTFDSHNLLGKSTLTNNQSYVQNGTEKAAMKSDVINAPSVAPVSNEESALAEQLTKAKSSGNMIEAQRIERRLAEVRGGGLSMIQDTGTGAEVVASRSAGLGTSGSKSIAPKWATQDILVAGTNLSEINPSITHDRNGNLYMAVERSGEDLLWVYQSNDNGSTWWQWYWFSDSAGIHNPSLAIGGGDSGRNYFFMADREANNNILVWRVNLTSGAWDAKDIEYNASGVSPPAIVTDATEFYNGWYGYIVYNAGGQLKFTRTLDYGGNWTTPIVLHSYNNSYPYNAAPGIDYGSYNVYVSYEDYNGANSFRDIFVRTSLSSYGGSWNPQVKLTTLGYDSFYPSVAAVKSNWTNRTAVVAYTDNYANSYTDYDTMYAYTQDGGNTWAINYWLSGSTRVEAYPVVTASDYQGKIHAAFWDNAIIDSLHGDIDYASTNYTTPYALGSSITRAINFNNSAYLAPPTITTEPRKSPQDEASVGWADSRNYLTNLYDPNTPNLLDVYFDAASFPMGGGCINYGTNPPRGIAPPKFGDWNIISSDNIVCNSTTITMNGNLQIRGKLSLNNVNLKMNVTNNGQYSIDTYPGSTFHISDINGAPSIITNGNVWNAYYTFRVNSSTDFALNGSKVNNAGYAYNLDTAGSNYNNAGIWINTNNAIINGSQIFSNHFIGIILYNSNGSSITNNYIYSNDWNGIYAVNSNNNYFANNDVSSNGYDAFRTINRYDGIELMGSNNNLLNNRVYSNGANGFLVSGDHNNFTGNNNVNNNGYDGFSVSGNYNNFTSNSYVYHNGYDGLAVSGSYNNFTSNYEVWFNGHDGLSASGSYNNFTNNSIVSYNNNNGITATGNQGNFTTNFGYYNGNIGMALTSSNCNILNNDFYYQSRGIVLSSSTGCLIKGNFVYGNSWRGIDIESSTYNLLDSNYAYYTGGVPDAAGIILVSSANNNMTMNYALNNTNWGIRLWNSPHAIVNKSTAYYNGGGISLEGSGTSDNSVIDANNALYNNYSAGVGIQLYNTNGNSIKNNIVTYNPDGIALYSSGYNNITNNDARFSSDIGIGLSSAWNNNLSNNIVDSSNIGVSLRSSNSNKIVNTNARLDNIGMYLFQSTGNNLTANNASKNNNEGFELSISSNNNAVRDNQIKNNGNYGLHIYSSSGNEARNNTVLSNGVGVYLDWSPSNTIIKNNVGTNQLAGIALQWSSNSNNINQNTVNSNGNISIKVSQSNNNIVQQNTATGSDAGIFLDWSKGNSISNNIASNNRIHGISTEWYSDNNKINDNIASNNVAGISLMWSSGDTIVNNSLNGNNVSTNLEWSSNNNLLQNNSMSSNNYGISLSWSSQNNTIKDNRIDSNALIGLYIRDSSNNLIYNNHVAANPINANDNGVNKWNITKTAGINIVGGSFLGGNYWSDYTGSDTNADGLGDTLLPYNSGGNILSGGDMYPLVSSSINTMVFARGADNSVMYQRWNGSAWSGWQNLGCCFVSNITATSSGSNISIFARSGGGSIYTMKWNGNAWGSWQNIGCCFASDVGATSSGSNISIFVRSPANSVYTVKWNGSAWGSWQNLACCFVSNVGATSSGSNISIFARSAANSIYTLRWNGSAWGSWQNIGCCFVSDIGSTSSGSNISIFARSAANSIYTLRWNGSAWGSWQSLGGSAAGDISSTSSGNQISISVRNAADNSVRYQNWNGLVWSGWTNLGGSIAGTPEVIYG